MQERPASKEALKAKLGAIVTRLEGIAKDRVSKRSTIEQRWLDDLRRYHGQYTAKEIAGFSEQDQSEIFINLTAPKTDAMVAKLQDLLFPTDDRNWGIQPTPIPEMTEEAKKARGHVSELKDKVGELRAAAEAGDPQARAKLPAIEKRIESLESIDTQLRQHVEEAKSRSGRMADLMHDQLKECGYQAAMRDSLEDSGKIGTGVAKGPIQTDKARRRWILSNGKFTMGEEAQTAVGFQHVNPWGFFPPLDVAHLSAGDAVLERHLMSEAKLRNLQHKSGFDKDALRRLLNSDARDSVPSYFQDLRSITGEGSQSTGKLYQVWEYSGPLTAEEMRDLHIHGEDIESAEELETEFDALQEVQARVWFCQGEVLKFAIYPYDSGEPMYSVFNIRKDEGCVFGFGVPHICKHAQDMLNAAARQMMNNAGVSSGPIFVIDKSQLEVDDNDWTIRPFKRFYSKDGIPKDEDPIRVINIDNHQAELAAIMAIAQKHMDDETGLTALAQGDQGSGVTKTAQGMAILINATNVIFRRIVKNFDDDMTVPNMRRLYDWNMQFSDREDIKGDYEVDARGSSVLLAREMQAQNLRLFALEFGSHPEYGPMLKKPEMLRKTVQALMLPADEVVLDNDTIQANEDKRRKEAEEAMKAEAASQGMSPEEMRIKQMELQLKQNQMGLEAEKANMDNMTTLRVAQLNHQTAMMTLAANSNVAMEEIAAKLQDKREERRFEAQKIKVEQYMTLTTGQTAGGLV
ncbi:hypothetical protein [Roseibium sp.]|uniref:hypothetical protein n=1 Tax=Roseibium sp. TaxID=1936156 RepID=UPI003B517A87